MLTHAQKTQIDRRIAELAWPALGALLVEPALLAVDSIMVGQLGTAPLAGLSLASTILSTVVGLCIFLSYATTAATARQVGAGNAKRALENGIDGIWLGAVLGVVLGVALAVCAQPLLAAFGASGATLAQATAYLRISAVGLPGMLVVLAATGTLRGLADTRTPLRASVAGALVNVPINYVFIYPVGLGIGGAAIGTATAQLFMAVWLGWTVHRHALRDGASLAPRGLGVLRALRSSVPMLARSVILRAALLVEIAGATQLGVAALAANQVTMTVWNFATYGMDALAMAAQILVGQASGAGDRRHLRDVLSRCLARGLMVGVVLGVGVAVLAPFIPHLMSSDAGVLHLATAGTWLAAACMPVSAVAFILDGVLIGAGDAVALAWLMAGSLAVYVPATWLAVWIAGAGSATVGGYLAVWAGYAGVFLGMRALTTYLRARGDAWIRLRA